MVFCVRRRTASFWHLVPFIILTMTARSALIPMLPTIKENFFRDYHPTWCIANRTDSLDSNHTGSLDCRSVASRYSGYFDSGSALLSFATASMWGRLSDSFGRRPFMIMSAITIAAPVVALYVISNLWFYWSLSLVAGATLGASYGSTGVIGPFVSDVSIPEQRTVYFGYVYAITCIGFAVMPLVGAYIDTDKSAHMLYTTSLGFALAGVVYTICCLPESLAPDQRAAMGPGQASGAAVSLLWKSPLVGLLAAISFCSSLPESGLVESALFYVQDKLHFTGIDNAWLFATTGFCGLVVQTLLLRWLLSVGDEKWIILLGLSANGIHMMGYAVSWKKWCMYVVEALAALSMIASPAIQSILSHSLKPSEQGAGLGLLASVTGLCSALGPLLFSALYSYCRRPPLSLPELPFYCGTGMVSIGVVLAAGWLPHGSTVAAAVENARPGDVTVKSADRGGSDMPYERLEPLASAPRSSDDDK